MHDSQPVEAPPPPPPTIDHSPHQDLGHHHHHHDIHVPHIPPPDDSPPDYPPPSYDDATNTETAPLLVGPPPNYGAFRAYADPDESSVESSEVENREGSMPEWLGQLVVVMIFTTIVYGFWSFINAPSNDPPLYPIPPTITTTTMGPS